MFTSNFKEKIKEFNISNQWNCKCILKENPPNDVIFTGNNCLFFLGINGNFFDDEWNETELSTWVDIQDWDAGVYLFNREEMSILENTIEHHFLNIFKVGPIDKEPTIPLLVSIWNTSKGLLVYSTNYTEFSDIDFNILNPKSSYEGCHFSGVLECILDGTDTVDSDLLASIKELELRPED